MGVVIDLITHEPLRIFLPWLVGGYLLGLDFMDSFLWRILFDGAWYEGGAETRARLRKMHKAAKEITGQTQ